MGDTGGARNLHLVGRGLKDGELERIAAECGLPIAPPHQETGRETVVVVPEGDGDTLAEAVRGGPAGVIEAIVGVRVPAEAMARELGHGGMFLSLSTRLAWTMDTAAVFCEGLVVRDLLHLGLRHDVELSLHEATINAVLHGNLDLGMSLVEDPGAFDEFCRHLSSRLEDPQRAAKRVELSAWREDGHLLVRVADYGKGYDPETIVVPQEITAKSGRGLSIMRTLSSGVTVLDGGRTVVMRYG